MKNIIINQISKKLVVMGLLLTLVTSSLVGANKKLELLTTPIPRPYGILWITYPDVADYKREYKSLAREHEKLFNSKLSDLGLLIGSCFQDFNRYVFQATDSLSAEKKEDLTLVLEMKMKKKKKGLGPLLGSCCTIIKEDSDGPEGVMGMQQLMDLMGMQQLEDIATSFDREATALNALAHGLTDSVFNAKASDLQAVLQQKMTDFKIQFDASSLDDRISALLTDKLTKEACFSKLLDRLIDITEKLSEDNISKDEL